MNDKIINLLAKNIRIITARAEDYPIIQNLSRLYIYDLSRSCGFISKDWKMPIDGLYKSLDLKSYFEENDREAYILETNDGELVGFILLDKQFVGYTTKLDFVEGWNIGEFFILAKFQGKGIAQEAARKIWLKYPGKWELSVIPENKPALSFWRKTICSITKGNYIEQIKVIDYDKYQPERYIFNFNISTNI